MRLIFTADWHCSASNLHMMGRFVDWLLKLCVKEHVSMLCNLGDAKTTYNPFDGRALNFLLRTVKRFKKEDIDWLMLLGNHDRYGMDDEVGNWFPALHAAGVKTITKPTVVQTSYNDLVCVPYASNPLALSDAFKRAWSAYKPNSILLFHTAIRGCRSNVLHRSESGVPLKALYSDKYLYCIGGDQHLPHKLGNNVFYTGSPICLDWGECNQTKRVLLFDSETGILKSISVPLPGMYDTSWPGFDKAVPKTWKDAQIRIHVPCDSSVTDVQKILLKATVHAKRKYKGAIITAVPEFEDSGTPAVSKSAAINDEVAIEEYVDSTCPSYLSADKSAIISYLIYQLSIKGFVRRTAQTVQLLSAEGRNFLNFKHVKVRLDRKGIIVVTGRNKDWPKRENGVGKTNFLQLLVVGLTGRTFKGQANDQWARRNCKRTAWVKLRLRLQDKRKCVISRMRRPTRLALVVNGVNRSTGIGTRGTQQALENLTGFTYESLRNAVYVDQTEVNQILAGSDAERKTIFSRLLNLERFEDARGILKKEVARIAYLKDELESSLEAYEDKIKLLRKIVADTDPTSELAALKRKIRKQKQLAFTSSRKVDKYDKRSRVRRWEQLLEKANEQLYSLVKNRDTLLEVKGAYVSDLAALDKAEDACPTCRQEITAKFRKSRLRVLKEGLEIVAKKVRKLDHIQNSLKTSMSQLQTKVEKNKASTIKWKQSYTQSKQELDTLRKMYAAVKKRLRTRHKYMARLRAAKARWSSISKGIEALGKDISVANYGIKVFSKDGLPAYLMQASIPPLNIAAAKYSKLISEDEIKVEFFADEDGIPDVRVNNAHGGEHIIDQSKGETRLASIITSFAVRDVTNPTPLLILDEPGEGLDAHNAKLLASVLREISRRFGTIFITTHSPVVLAELEGERKIIIEKKNKVARIVEQ